MLADSWQTDRHIVWDLDWPATPIGGPWTAETWRAGDRYRIEILAAPAAALNGETVVFNGQDAWQYNRFDPPAKFEPTSGWLSPVSEAFAEIDRLTKTLPQTAHQESTQLEQVPVRKITGWYDHGQKLTIWRHVESGLPLRIQFLVAGQVATLQARHFEPLVNPPDELFGVGDWIRNTR
jgi:outer membrane lipoprotein-sorting protein